MPFLSAAKATIILKVDPGAYWPAIALLFRGARGLDTKAFHSELDNPRLKAFGSKPGVDASARISPVCTSITTAEAACLASLLETNFCKSISIVK